MLEAWLRHNVRGRNLRSDLRLPPPSPLPTCGEGGQCAPPQNVIPAQAGTHASFRWRDI